MYRVDYESIESLNRLAVILRDNNSCKIGNVIPPKIAKSIVSLVPDEWFEPKGDELIEKYKLDLDKYTENHRVLDICCNSGVLLTMFMNKFYNVLHSYKNFTEETDLCYEYILKNLLYGICSNKFLCREIRGVLYNNKNVHGNIFNYGVSSDVVNSNFEIRDGKVFIYDSNKKEKVEMKFDVVCGNPPYNNDMYIDFVQLGHELSKSYSLWITPAKFWAKSTCDNDEKFRSMVKGSGDSFVVYKNCKDIFDISEPGGIAYYLLGRDNKDSKYRIKCIHKNSVAFQSDFEKHDSLDFLPLSTLNILNKFGKSNFKNTLGLRQSFYVKNTETGMSEANLGVDIYSGKNLCGSISADELFTTDNLDKYKCIQNCICGSGSFQADNTGAFLGMPPIYILKPNEVGKGSFHHLRFFDTNSEATHFVEFMNTKLVNFAYTCGLCGTTNSAEFYRYIPDPGSFDRIFEDRPLDDYTPDENGEYIDKDGNKHCSLYVKYGLTDEEINVIESVIRERK